MRCSSALALFPIACFAISPALRADAIVSSFINLTTLTITPLSGSLEIIPPLAASAFAQAQDSLGGFDAQFNSVNDSATSVTASTALADASASASAPLLNASAASGVGIPNITASASSSGSGGPGSLVGQLEITGTSGPVNVQLSAKLLGDQSLTTDGGGQTGSSELIFSLLLPSISSSPELFYDNPLTIGPDSILVSPLNTTLMVSVTLQANTPYPLIAEVDAESSGLNIVPEPSLLPLAALGLCAICVFRRRVR